ncbi:MAG: 1-(5-phosphoribosyl)-5-[(5-phosphoribosylamino)methylideneamino]imidazole-4-carboxamide isomerase [Acidimicrobiaceae bacterium]|nr:1-(5-phosphoribosyl)-5-[(5-phosphoribosylamino)methylideneamino]imidazole-4-carboxamide isomerase [Acidimicrobiaceae bacterium]
MDLFPAIDLRGGRCVRLVQGDFSRETVYGDDPVAVARHFARQGAPWIHVVDLDAARTGDPVNRPVVTEIAASVTIPVQTGGGVRSAADAAALLGSGVTRVVVGTAAVERPELVGEIAERWPGRVAVGLDHRDGEVRLRGWVAGGGRRVAELIPDAVAAGAVAVIVTDISRDGRLAGPDVTGLAALLELTGAPLVASGGVSSLDDLRLLAAVRAGGQGLAGAIVGKALYEGAFSVAEAVAACTALDPPAGAFDPPAGGFDTGDLR